jgi:hypothetical protein
MDKEEIKEQLETAHRLLDWAIKEGSKYKMERFGETINYLEKKYIEECEDDR